MDFNYIISAYNNKSIKTVSSLQNLYNIPIWERKDGMIVLIENINNVVVEYKMKLGTFSFDLLDNENWIPTNKFSINIPIDTNNSTAFVLPPLSCIIEVYESINNTELYSLLPFNSGDYTIEYNNGLYLLVVTRIMTGYIRFIDNI